ncbi:MAG TPA: glycosyltransferase family 2 protein [Bryobacteraceae bacterium]|nr:glycosyltransferase family 2 protein [Bryobacteraceae bacterium]
MTGETVAVTIVTFNSARFIARCLQYLFEQNYPNIEVIVVDNASSDETTSILDRLSDRIKFVRNERNVGFAEAQNYAINLSKSAWVLTLNPDVRLSPDFVEKAVAAAEVNENIGSISGKLLRMAPDFEIPARKTLDSTGIYFTPALRHFDRGSGEPDGGAYDQVEYVFGVSGAAALYRRKMIDDVSIEGEFFDSDFFAYREDADLAWRAQLLGWKCLYTPDAIAYHVRAVLPSNRKSLAAAINMHSVKNRFLMRIKNITPDLYIRHLLPITLRDLVVLGGCLLREFSSLPAFLLIIRNFGKMHAKRREIMRRRRADSRYIAAWFSNRPTSFSLVDNLRNTPTRAVTSR